ncbi:MAG: hypothetical protein M5U31_00315 [Acidimicrobiia bacterium]|nr:hypothetical protein [Acidimicrobiia bacterium]
MQLRVPAPRRGWDPTFHKTTLEELDTATGLDARQALKTPAQ